MSKNEEKGIGGIIGNLMRGMMGATAPMLTGLIKSVLSPGMIKSVVGMVPYLLNAVGDAVSSIGIRELISSINIPSIEGAVLRMTKILLDPLLSILDPLIEALLDMLTPILGVVGRLLETAGAMFEPVNEALGPLYDAIAKVLDPLLGYSA